MFRDNKSCHHAIIFNNLIFANSIFRYNPINIQIPDHKKQQFEKKDIVTESTQKIEDLEKTQSKNENSKSVLFFEKSCNAPSFENNFNISENYFYLEKGKNELNKRLINGDFEKNEIYDRNKKIFKCFESRSKKVKSYGYSLIDSKRNLFYILFINTDNFRAS